jgi:hypothetical protein
MADRTLIRLGGFVNKGSYEFGMHTPDSHQLGKRGIAPVMGLSLTPRGLLRH